MKSLDLILTEEPCLKQISTLYTLQEWEITDYKLVANNNLNVYYSTKTTPSPSIDLLLSTNEKIINLALRKSLLSFNKWTAPRSHIPKLKFKPDQNSLERKRLYLILDKLEQEQKGA